MLRWAALLSCAAVCAASCPFASARGKRAVAAVGDAPWMPQAPVASDPTDPLVQANNLFHTLYYSAGRALLPSAVIMVENDYLVLLRRDASGNYTRARVDQITPNIYHELKMVAHLPYAAFVALLPFSQNMTSVFPRAQIITLQSSIQKASATLSSRFPASQLPRQLSIAGATQAFLGSVLAAGSVSNETLTAFARGVMPDILVNIQDAATAQTDTMIAVLRAWRSGPLADGEWEGLRFVSTASHMAREDNIFSQIFARMLSANPAAPEMEPNGPNMRFVTLDDTDIDEGIASTLLATHHTDYLTGAAFFGDPYRMHRDLLADATTAYLEELFPSTT